MYKSFCGKGGTCDKLDLGDSVWWFGPNTKKLEGNEEPFVVIERVSEHAYVIQGLESGRQHRTSRRHSRMIA